MQNIFESLGIHENIELPYILTKDEEANAIIQAKIMECQRLNERYKKLGKTFTLDDTPINEEQVLDRANRYKHHDQMLIEHRAKRKAEQEEAIKMLRELYDADGLTRYAKDKAKNDFKTDFVVDSYNAIALRAVVLHLSGDKRLETEMGMSRDKGIMLRGVCGVGKSFIFDCLHDNPAYPFRRYSMIKIVDAIRSEGVFNLNMNTPVYLDDVGAEDNMARNYGNRINFFQEFIEKMYASRENYCNIYISTNNTDEDMTKMYGKRVADRLVQMFNVIEIKGENRRK